MKNTLENLRYTVPAGLRMQRLKEVQGTRTFLAFIEERSFDEQKLLFAQINRILEEGIPLDEFISAGMEYELDGETSYQKIAVCCFAEALAGVVENNHERAKPLEDPIFKEIYNDVFNHILDYMDNDRPDFPSEALRCLFLLTDADVDPYRQELAAAHLLTDCFPFCLSEQQEKEIEQRINQCKIPIK